MTNDGNDNRNRWLVLALTLTRLPLATSYFVLSLAHFSSSRWFMVIACSLVELSDVSDGWIARRLGIASAAGGIADSAVDHVARVTEFTALLLLGIFPAYVFLLIILRDAVVMTIRQISVQFGDGVPVGTRWSGKIKGIGQGGYIIFLTSIYAVRVNMSDEGWHAAANSASALVAAVTVLSLADYTVAYFRVQMRAPLGGRMR